MSMKKLLIFIISILILLPNFSVIGFAEEEEEDGVKTKGAYYDIDAPEYESEIALLVNVDTDTVIYSKNADMVTAPASLAKIVTALVVLSKDDDFNTPITCSKEAVDSLLGTGSSIVGLLADEVVPLEMLLYALFLPSANDAAVVLAEHYGNGDVQAFVDEMNEYCKKLGCKNTFFANPHGLDNEDVEGFDGKTQNQTTASDMYLISKEALKNDNIKKISSKYGKTMPPTNKHEGERYLYNTNALINEYSYYYYEGAVGLKTGTTDKAGACLISSATKDGYTYIAVSMKGNFDYYDKGEARNTAFITCRYLLRWAFNNIKMKVLADEAYNVGEVAVKFGRGADYVAVVPESDITAVVHKDIDIDDMTVKFPKDFPEAVDSPVKEGDVIGKAGLYYKGIKVTDLTLVAQQTVKKNYLWAMFSWVEKLMTSKVFIAVIVIALVLVIVIILGTKNNRKRRKRRKRSVQVIKDYSKLAK